MSKQNRKNLDVIFYNPLNEGILQPINDTVTELDSIMSKIEENKADLVLLNVDTIQYSDGILDRSDKIEEFMTFMEEKDKLFPEVRICVLITTNNPNSDEFVQNIIYSGVQDITNARDIMVKRLINQLTTLPTIDNVRDFSNPKILNQIRKRRQKKLSFNDSAKSSFGGMLSRLKGNNQVVTTIETANNNNLKMLPGTSGSQEKQFNKRAKELSLREEVLLANQEVSNLKETIQSLTEELEKSKAQLVQNEKDISSSRQLIKEYQSQLTQAESKYKQLEALRNEAEKKATGTEQQKLLFAEMKGELALEKAKSESLQETNGHLKENILNLEQKVEQLTSDKEKMKATDQAQLERLEAELIKAKKGVEDNKKQVDAYNTLLKEFDEFKASIGENAPNDQELEKIQLKVTNQKETIRQLNKKILDQKNDIEKYVSSNKKFETKINALEEGLSTSESAIEKYARNIESKDAEILELRAQISKLSDEIEEKHQLLEHTSEEAGKKGGHENLLLEIEEKEKKILLLTKEKEEFEKENQSLLGDLEEKAQKISVLSSADNESRKTIETQIQSIAQLKDKLSSVTATAEELASFKDKHYEMQKELNRIEQEQSELNVDTIRHELQIKTERAEELQEQLRELSKNNLDTQDKYEQISFELVQQKDFLDKEKTKNNELRKELSDLQQYTGAANKEELEEALEFKRNSNDVISEKIKKYESENKNLQQEVRQKARENYELTVLMGGNKRKRVLTAAAAAVLLLLLGGGAGTVIHARNSPQVTEASSSNIKPLEELLENKDYVSAVEQYPNKTEEIEDAIFQRLTVNKDDSAGEILISFNQTYPTIRGDFDLAMLNSNYRKMIDLYLNNKEKFAESKSRLLLAGYAMLKEDDLEGAEKIQKDHKLEELETYVTDYKKRRKRLDEAIDVYEKVQDLEPDNEQKLSDAKNNVDRLQEDLDNL